MTQAYKFELESFAHWWKKHAAAIKKINAGGKVTP